MMQAQIEATKALTEALRTTQGLSAPTVKKLASENAAYAPPQLARALTWLAAYPDRQGLSLRKAAASAGVSEGTLRKALKLVSDQGMRQERLL